MNNHCAPMVHRTSVESPPDTCYCHPADMWLTTGQAPVSPVKETPMLNPVRLPLYLSWRALKQVGWPYSRSHTERLETDEKYAHDPFPRRGKIGTHRNAHPIWYTPTVLDYSKRHGLPVPEAVEFSV